MKKLIFAFILLSVASTATAGHFDCICNPKFVTEGQCRRTVKLGRVPIGGWDADSVNKHGAAFCGQACGYIGRPFSGNFIWNGKQHTPTPNRQRKGGAYWTAVVGNDPGLDLIPACCPNATEAKEKFCRLIDHSANGYRNAGRATPKSGADGGFPQSEDYLDRDKCPYIANIENIWKKDGQPDIVDKVILYRCKNSKGQINEQLATNEHAANMLLWSHCLRAGFNHIRLNSDGRLECYSHCIATPDCGHEINQRISSAILPNTQIIADKRD